MEFKYEEFAEWYESDGHPVAEVLEHSVAEPVEAPTLGECGACR